MPAPKLSMESIKLWNRVTKCSRNLQKLGFLKYPSKDEVFEYPIATLSLSSANPDGSSRQPKDRAALRNQIISCQPNKLGKSHFSCFLGNLIRIYRVFDVN